MADVGIIATWGERGAPLVIEASRGLSPEVLEVVRRTEMPDLGPALEAPGAVIAFESLGSFLNGTEVAAVMAKEGLSDRLPGRPAQSRRVGRLPRPGRASPGLGPARRRGHPAGRGPGRQRPRRTPD